ncbi:MAG: hypothetical protein HS111_25140 [Kofleriaceae bacterium]|nr:hypothetical protein [Kofleriaceae bacterium]
MHELVTELGVLHAILGAWRTYDLAICDTRLMNLILDTPQGDVDLRLPAGFPGSRPAWPRSGSSSSVAGTPGIRAGDLLHDGHLEAIGGLARVKAEVEPARVDRVGELTYIQLTESIETALTPVAGEATAAPGRPDGTDSRQRSRCRPWTRKGSRSASRSAQPAGVSPARLSAGLAA